MNAVNRLIILVFIHFSALLPADQLTVIDHTASFETFRKEFAHWKDAPNNQPLRAMLVFMAYVHGEFPEFYDFRLRGNNKEPETVFSHLQHYEKIRDRYLKVAKLLPKYLQDSLATFKKAFPDFTAPFQAHLVHSLGEMDGGTRTINGKFYFLFGVDKIAEEHKSLDFKSKQPFLHHELFHVYHRQFFPDDDALVPGLWAEGLAVLTAEELNPKATLAQLSLDNPKDLIKKCERVRARLIADMKDRLEAPTALDYETYFLNSSGHSWIPKRAGYYVGYRIAKLARKQKTLEQLANLNPEEVKSLILSLIDKI